MTLQARLTLYFVLLAILMVTTISAINLNDEVQARFEDTLKRAQRFQNLAVEVVIQNLNRDRKLSIEEALGRPELAQSLGSIMRESPIEELAVVDPARGNQILLDSFPGVEGQKLQSRAGFESLVQQASGYRKLRVLAGDASYYQLRPTPLAAPPSSELMVYAIIDPSLIGPDIVASVKEKARVGVGALICAVIATFLFARVAFRPLAAFREQLELVASGQFTPEPAPDTKSGSDEFSVMASKVSLLGERLRNIDRLLQDLEDAVLIFDRDRRLVFSSGSLRKFVGRERAEIQGASMELVFPESTALGLVIGHAWETRQEVRNRRIAGVQLSVDPLGEGILVRLRDAEAQRKIGRELQTADRLSAISRISGGVAHEVKNPLNAILLHVEVARAKLGNGDTDVAPQMEVISREILRLDRVVKTFLDFTRPVELHLADVPLHELLAELVDLARPQAEMAGISFAVEEAAENAVLRIDRDMVKQAVLNIVVNAMQAMPEGGELTLATRLVEESAEIRVTDTGPGIPPELRDKIFRLYYTTKPGGSGIGLAMTFRIVQLHDGTIDFTSEPGHGATFMLRLPAAV